MTQSQGAALPQERQVKQAMLRGALGRCPACGKGKLFAGFLPVAERCDVCDFDLKSADPGDGPAIFVMLIGGFLVVFAALIVEANFKPLRPP